MTHYIKSCYYCFCQKSVKIISVSLIFILISNVSFAQLTSDQIDTLSNRFLKCLQNKDYVCYEKLFASADFYSDYYYNTINKSEEDEYSLINKYPLIFKTEINYEYKTQKLHSFKDALYFERQLNFDWKNMNYINHKVSSPNHFETDNGITISRENDYILLMDKTTNKYYVMDIVDIIAYNKVLLGFKIKDVKESKTFDEYESKYNITRDVIEATEAVEEVETDK